MKKLERTLKVFANARRLAILKFLKSHREAKVSDIAKEIHLSFKSTSRHMNLLFAASLVDRDQHRLEMHYRLTPAALPLIKSILDLE